MRAAGAPAAGGEAAPAAAPKKLVVAHRKEYFEEMETLFVAAVQDWAKENNYEVETNLVASGAFEDFVAKLLAQIQAGDPPSPGRSCPSGTGTLRSGWIGSSDRCHHRSDQALWRCSLWPHNHREDRRRWWGIPYMSSGRRTICAKDAFEAAGVDIAATTTFDERREAALKASNPDAQMYGWGITVNKSGDGRGFIEAVIQNYGGHYTDEGLTAITFNSPETLAVVDLRLAETYLSEKYQPMLPPGVTSWTDSRTTKPSWPATLP